MPYGTIKVDTVTFTDAGVDKSVSISGLVQNPTFSGNITVTGTISGGVVRGGTVSGATVTGTAGQFTTATITSGVFASGTAAAPSIAFAGDLDTGLFTGAANTVGIAANGSAVLTVSGTNVGIGTANPLEKFHVSGGPLLVAGELQGVRASSTALDYSSNSTRLIAMGPDVSTTSPILFLNGTSSSVTEKARIDTSGRLLIGTSVSRSNDLFAASQFQLEGTDAGTSSISIFRNTASTGAGGIALCKSRSASLGGVTIVQNGDALGFIDFQGTDGTDLARAATIEARVDGTPGNNIMPGRLMFSTALDGSTSAPTERMRITNAGHIGIGTTSPGIISGLSKYLTLSATGSSEAPGFEIVGNRNSSSSTVGRISFINVATGNNEVARINCQTSSSGPLTEGVLVFSTSGTSRLIIDANGNVGIGTSPFSSTALDVKTTTNSHIIFSNAAAYASNAVIAVDDAGGERALGIGGNPIQFFTGTNERARINSSGQLLIGTTANGITNKSGTIISTTSTAICAQSSNPVLYLVSSRASVAADIGGHVSFNAVYRNADSDTTDVAFVKGLRENATDNTWAGYLSFGTAASAASPTEKMRITSAGLVGIGTVSPSNSLQVSSSALAAVPSAGVSGHFLAVGSAGYGIAGGALTNGNSYLQVTRWDGTATNYDLLLQPNGGRVAIGTTNPDVKLHVATGNGTGYIKLDGGTSSQATTGILFRSNTDNYQSEISSYQGNLQFVTGVNERARIDGAGRLLVGTTDASRILGNGVKIKSNDVGTGYSSGALILEGTGGDFYAINFSPSNMGIASITSGATDYLVFGTTTAGYGAILVLFDDGKIQCPGVYNYAVGGTNRDVYVDSSGYIGYVSSTRESKTNIQEIEDVSWLYQLNPVTFNRKERNVDPPYNFTDVICDRTEYGLIAEEVEPIAPDLCFYDEVDGVQKLSGIQYSQLITPLLKAVQQANERITALEAEIAALKAQ